MPRSIHPISVKEHNPANFYFLLTLAASILSSIIISFTGLLKPLETLFKEYNIPFSTFIPTIGTVYPALLKLWNMGLWKVFKKVGLIDLPDIDGTWFGKIWYEREQRYGYGILIVEQKYTKGFIKGCFESGINTDSQTLEFSAIDSATPEIITNYLAQGVTRGRGTAFLNLELNEGTIYLQGEFFTDITHTSELRTGHQVYMKVSTKKIWNLEGMRRKVLETDKKIYEYPLTVIDHILERNIQRSRVTTVSGVVV